MGTVGHYGVPAVRGAATGDREKPAEPVLVTVDEADRVLFTDLGVRTGTHLKYSPKSGVGRCAVSGLVGVYIVQEAAGCVLTRDVTVGIEIPAVVMV